MSDAMSARAQAKVVVQWIVDVPVAWKQKNEAVFKASLLKDIAAVCCKSPDRVQILVMHEVSHAWLLKKVWTYSCLLGAGGQGDDNRVAGGGVLVTISLLPVQPHFASSDRESSPIDSAAAVYGASCNKGLELPALSSTFGKRVRGHLFSASTVEFPPAGYTPSAADDCEEAILKMTVVLDPADTAALPASATPAASPARPGSSPAPSPVTSRSNNTAASTITWTVPSNPAEKAKWEADIRADLLRILGLVTPTASRPSERFSVRGYRIAGDQLELTFSINPDPQSNVSPFEAAVALYNGESVQRKLFLKQVAATRCALPPLPNGRARQSIGRVTSVRTGSYKGMPQAAAISFVFTMPFSFYQERDRTGFELNVKSDISRMLSLSGGLNESATRADVSRIAVHAVTAGIQKGTINVVCHLLCSEKQHHGDDVSLIDLLVAAKPNLLGVMTKSAKITHAPGGEGDPGFVCPGLTKWGDVDADEWNQDTVSGCGVMGCLTGVHTPCLEVAYLRFNQAREGQPAVDITQGGVLDSIGWGTAKQPASSQAGAAGTLYASHSFAVGPGTGKAQAGKISNFTVIACDRNGHWLQKGGHVVKVKFEPVQRSRRSESAQVDHIVLSEVSDVGDGSYNVTYVGNSAGSYFLTVTIDGTAVRGAPFRVSILPGPVHPLACSVQLSSAPAPHKGHNVMTVKLSDEYGNLYSTSNDGMAVSLYHNTQHALKLVNRYDGSYTCTVPPPDSSTMLVAFLHGRYPCQQVMSCSPTVFQPARPCKAWGLADPRWSRVLGEGRTRGFVNAPASFSLQCWDSVGNHLTQQQQQGNISVLLNGPLPAATLKSYLSKHQKGQGNVIADWCSVYGSAQSLGGQTSGAESKVSSTELFRAKLETSHSPGDSSRVEPNEHRKPAARRVGEHSVFPQTLYHGPSPANEDGVRTGLLNPVNPSDIPRVGSLLNFAGWPGSGILECDDTPWRTDSWTVNELLTLLDNPEVPSKKLAVVRDPVAGTYSGSFLPPTVGLYSLKCSLIGGELRRKIGMGSMTCSRQFDCQGRSLVLVTEGPPPSILSRLVKQIASASDFKIIEKCYNFVHSIHTAFTQQPGNKKLWRLPANFPALAESLQVVNGGMEFLHSIVGFKRSHLQRFGTRDQMLAKQGRSGSSDPTSNEQLSVSPNLPEGSILFIPEAPSTYTMVGLASLLSSLHRVLTRRPKGSALRTESDLDIDELALAMHDAVVRTELQTAVQGLEEVYEGVEEESDQFFKHCGYRITPSRQPNSLGSTAKRSTSVGKRSPWQNSPSVNYKSAVSVRSKSVRSAQQSPTSPTSTGRIRRGSSPKGVATSPKVNKSRPAQ